MICISFDTDHVREEFLQNFLESYSIPGNATFFLDRPYPSINWHNHEVGPHPFVQNLDTFENDFIAYVKKLNISPKGARAHSCVFSQMMALQLKESGIEYISTTTPTGQKGLFPYRYSWGIWEMPIYYMDNMDMCMPVNWPTLNNYKIFDKKLITAAIHDPASLYVFDFHPIHIMLNTTSFNNYQEIKGKIINDGENPANLAMPGYGVASFFSDLCKEMTKQSIQSKTMSEALSIFKHRTNK
jgi:hypothetical protein